ncbi:MAG: nitroreductase family protein [Lachnospiraceae bacterium]|nr:nitroreductase family protein [Lachnospiraceae bacterium]
MTVFEAMANRSSTRAYTNAKVATEEIEEILKAGLQGPTGTNRKEIRFSVVKGDNPILAEIDKEKRMMRAQGELPNNFYYDAPIVIFLSAETYFKWSKIDAGIAVQNMALAAEGLGLGSLIIGSVFDALNGVRKKEFDKALKIPEGFSFEIALAVGRKAEEKAPHDYKMSEQVFFID